MKKLLFSTLFLFVVSTQVQAQWFNKIVGNGILKTEQRTIKSFNKIEVSGPFNVALVYGDENNIRIKMEENLSEYLITEVKNNKLSIHWKKNTNIRSKRGVHIVVPFKNIQSVVLTGSGDIICDDTIKIKKFSTLVTGSGDVILHIDAKNITAKVTGSGNIELLGASDYLEVVVTGSGGFQAYKLITENANAKVTGSGDIGLLVKNDLIAKVLGSGDIIYKGHPKNQELKVLGSGDIIEK